MSKSLTAKSIAEARGKALGNFIYNNGLDYMSASPSESSFAFKQGWDAAIKYLYEAKFKEG